MATLRIDPKRLQEFPNTETGIYVRAQGPDDKWLSADIVHLDKASLNAWLRSRGGENPWAEDVVGILLGHGHLSEASSR